jgi:hypothetical protein
MNARYYLPEVGRFISPDTIVPEPGNPQSYNRYAYVLNSPVNYTDPTGHKECSAHCPGEPLDWRSNSMANYHGDYDIASQQKYQQAAETVKNGMVGTAETIASVIWEPVDWGIALSDGFQWHDSLGMLPFIPSTVGKHSDELITLYRAVSPDELIDIQRTGIFRPHPAGRSMDAKWFSETYKGARKWGNRMLGEFEVVSVTVTRTVADEMYRVRNLDGIADARAAMDDVLDRFNEAIQGLKVGK